jgi:hypothetical protein
MGGAVFGSPQEDPGTAPPMASGMAGSGLRPAYEGGAQRPPCPLGELRVSVVDLSRLNTKLYETDPALINGVAAYLAMPLG